MKTFTISKQPDNLYTVTTIETTVEKDVPLTLAPPVVPPAPSYLFRDDFTSMDTKASANGISWGAGNFGSGDKKPIITNECPYTGKPSLKFTFGGGVAIDDAWCEQRINLPSMPEFWIQFYRYYPNGTESPSIGPKWAHRDAPGSDNNKLCVFWGGDYRGYNLTVGISAWTNAGRDAFYPAIGSNQGMSAGPNGLPSVPAQDDSTLGRWVKVKIRCKCATSANNDGVLQYWEDDVLKMDHTAMPIYPKDGIGNAFTEGYLMGWSNSGFDQTTHCYIADVIIHDKPI